MEYRYRKKDEPKEQPPPMRAFVPKSASMTKSRSKAKRQRNTLMLSILLLILLIVVIGITLLNLAKSDKEIPGRTAPLAQGGQKMLEPRIAQNQTEPKYSILSLLNEDGLINAYINAASTDGRDALRNLSSTRSTGQIRWDGQLKECTLTKQRPDLLRLNLKSDDSITTYGYDGRAYWRKLEVGKNQAESGSIEESNALRQISKFYDPLIAYAMEGAGIIQVIEIDEWRGDLAIRVQMRGTSLSRIDIYLDPDSLEILATVQRLPNSGDEYTTLFSDYRFIDGFRSPFQIQNMLGNQLVYELSLDTMEVNPVLTSSLFSAPEPI
jgi:hypothetical protein